MNLFTKQKQSHKQKTNLWGGWGDRLEVWYLYIHTTMYKIGKPQGPAYSTENYTIL